MVFGESVLDDLSEAFASFAAEWRVDSGSVAPPHPRAAEEEFVVARGRIIDMPLVEPGVYTVDLLRRFADALSPGWKLRVVADLPSQYLHITRKGVTVNGKRYPFDLFPLGEWKDTVERHRFERYESKRQWVTIEKSVQQAFVNGKPEVELIGLFEGHDNRPDNDAWFVIDKRRFLNTHKSAGAGEIVATLSEGLDERGIRLPFGWPCFRESRSHHFKALKLRLTPNCTKIRFGTSEVGFLEFDMSNAQVLPNMDGSWVWDEYGY